MVNNAEHVRLAFLKIKRLEATADHVMMAYRIREEADVHQGSVSNGEHFGDVEVMKVLESHNYVNIVVFIARHYGGICLGKLRLTLIKQVTEEALAKMSPMVYVLPKPPRPAVQHTQRQAGGGGGSRGGRGHGERGQGNHFTPKGRGCGDPNVGQGAYG